MSNTASLVLSIMSVVIVVTVFILTNRSNFIINRIEQDQDDIERVSTHIRRYRTLDEMRYILYGVGEQYSMYDKQVLEYIRSQISLPSLTRPRQLDRPSKHDESQAGQSKFVDKLLSRRRNGFFIECGALEGERHSNTLFFELERNWTGILIEANPNYHSALLSKNRRAYVLRACLSTERRPMTVRIQPATGLSGITDKMHQSHLFRIRGFKKPEIVVNCFPLNTVMASLNVNHVDYFSLDVEGAEIDILRTVDWKRLHIDVITIEYAISGGPRVGRNKSATSIKLQNLRKFFRDTGLYKEVGVLNQLDVVFSHV